MVGQVFKTDINHDPCRKVQILVGIHYSTRLDCAVKLNCTQMCKIPTQNMRLLQKQKRFENVKEYMKKQEEKAAMSTGVINLSKNVLPTEPVQSAWIPRKADK